MGALSPLNSTSERAIRPIQSALLQSRRASSSRILPNHSSVPSFSPFRRPTFKLSGQLSWRGTRQLAGPLQRLVRRGPGLPGRPPGRARKSLRRPRAQPGFQLGPECRHPSMILTPWIWKQTKALRRSHTPFEGARQKDTSEICKTSLKKPEFRKIVTIFSTASGESSKRHRSADPDRLRARDFTSSRVSKMSSVS